MPGSQSLYLFWKFQVGLEYQSEDSPQTTVGCMSDIPHPTQRDFIFQTETKIHVDATNDKSYSQLHLKVSLKNSI